MHISIGLLTLQLHLATCFSLKQKRSIIRPVLSRLHKEFNVSAAEVGYLDDWKNSILAVTFVSNDGNVTRPALQKIIEFVQRQWPDIELVDQTIELL